MAPLPTNLFDLLRAIVNGYQITWTRMDGWHLEPSPALLQQWVDRGEIG